MEAPHRNDVFMHQQEYIWHQSCVNFLSNKAMSKIPSVVVPTIDTSPEFQSTSVSSLREELAAASPSSSTLEDQSNGGITESIDGGSTVSITEDINQQDNLESTPSEDQLAVVVQDDSRASSTVSTSQSPMRGRFIPSPLDIASGTTDSSSLQLSRTLSPLARGAVKAGGGVKGGGGGGGGVSPRIAAVGSHTPPGVSRVSSLDSPQSPFFIPTNPFLMHIEKMPKFQWTMPHFNLLENILKSLQEIVNKWKMYDCQKFNLHSNFSYNIFILVILSVLCLITSERRVRSPSGPTLPISWP